MEKVVKVKCVRPFRNLVSKFLLVSVMVLTVLGCGTILRSVLEEMDRETESNVVSEQQEEKFVSEKDELDRKKIQYRESGLYQEVHNRLPDKYWDSYIWLRYGISELDGLTIRELFLSLPPMKKSVDEGTNRRKYSRD